MIINLLFLVRDKYIKGKYIQLENKLSSLESHSRISSIKDLTNEGGVRCSNLISNENLSSINSELDEIFSVPVINQTRSGSIWHSSNYKRVANPTRIQAINILELSIKVMKLVIPLENQLSTILTNLDIFSEKNNSQFLPWHTDGRKGMTRAQIYLSGGGAISGGFLYIAKSHLLNHGVTHYLCKDKLEGFNDSVLDLSGLPGDLVAFDPYGFHAKNPCIEERRTIMFEFQDKDSEYIKSSLDICSTKFTEDVVKNISLFLPGKHLNSYGLHGLDEFQKTKKIPLKLFGVFLKLFYSSITSSFLRKFQRILISFRK